LINEEKFMGAKPLAEVYEHLKELRRQGGLSSEMQSRIGNQLQLIYDDVPRQGVPDRHMELIRRLDIKTLADRIFGDEDRAEAWLERPNASLSGQKPADLLKDELGAAVVREMLERIDHGIFA
jgi:hypothetical protein